MLRLSRGDRYDIVTKDALHQFPEDILRTVLGHGNFQFLGFEESELTRVEVRRTDSLIKVRLGDVLVLVHIEFQVSDSAPINMVRRNVGYLGRCYEKYGLPVLSHVIYLRPNAGTAGPGRVLARGAGLPVHRGLQSDPSQ